MGKTRGVHETTPELRNRMVGMYEAGLGLREIAAAVNCSVRIFLFIMIQKLVDDCEWSRHHEFKIIYK